MTFATTVSGHVSTWFLNTSHFAETITFVPANGQRRSISAVVTPREALDEAGQLLSHEDAIEVTVANSATTGITAPRKGDGVVLSGGDAAFPYRWNGTTPEDLDGMITLEFIRQRPAQAGIDHLTVDE
jgi:hypothetical protein